MGGSATFATGFGVSLAITANSVTTPAMTIAPMMPIAQANDVSMAS
jgi:hypothetical protein